MNDADLIKLYSGRILALAAHIPLTERLSNPDGTARVRAPLCGSSVTVDVSLCDGRIVQYGQDVKACALGQAAASILGSHVIGQTPAAIATAHDQLNALLKDDGPMPQAPFDMLEVLRPAGAYRNRHASILLAFDATLTAIANSGKADCA